MTIPVERYRAVAGARRLLFDLINPQATSRVPKIIRRRASAVLRHFPWDSEMRITAEKCPELWTIEDL